MLVESCKVPGTDPSAGINKRNPPDVGVSIATLVLQMVYKVQHRKVQQQRMLIPAARLGSAARRGLLLLRKGQS